MNPKPSFSHGPLHSSPGALDPQAAFLEVSFPSGHGGRQGCFWGASQAQAGPTTAASAIGDTIALQSQANGQYVCAHDVAKPVP